MTKEEYIEKFGIEKYEEYAKKNRENAKRYYHANKDKCKAAQKKYREEHPDCRAIEYAKRIERNPDSNKKRYQQNKEIYKARSKQYYISNKEKCLEYSKQWAEKNKEKITESKRRYSEKHKEEIIKKYYDDKKTRAGALSRSYRRNDLEYNRGKSTLTTEWLLKNVFNNQTCFYCGESDWTKLGCDRIDNAKPHAPDNVVVSCHKCNERRARQDFGVFCKKMGVKYE